MSRNPMQKQKLLYLRKILLEKTDENHGLTSSEILAELALYGITAERKSLYDDLQVLEKFGMDICKSKSSTVKYYVASREFELPELKLLVDAIQSSKFITEKKSISLIHKLEGLASVHDGKELQRQVFVANRAKTMNERIYYSVDKIQNAIALNRKISFKYYRWELDFSGTERIVKREKIRNGGYTASPWALCWDDENYYLIAYDTCADSIKHYRVDKMDDIEVLDDERDGDRLSKRACVEKVDARNYSQWFSPRLIFDNTPLKDIVINLERRYNIEISLSSNISPEKRLSLVVCHEPLEDLMEVMSSLMSIRYRIDGNRVLITQR